MSKKKKLIKLNKKYKFTGFDWTNVYDSLGIDDYGDSVNGWEEAKKLFGDFGEIKDSIIRDLSLEATFRFEARKMFELIDRACMELHGESGESIKPSKEIADFIMACRLHTKAYAKNSITVWGNLGKKVLIEIANIKDDWYFLRFFREHFGSMWY